MDDSFNRLKARKPKDMAAHTIVGVHSYDILANPLYLDDFQYVHAGIPNRSDYIIDGDDKEGNDNEQSDLVRAVFGLGYMTSDQADQF